jgi:hypothetical protein
MIAVLPKLCKRGTAPVLITRATTHVCIQGTDHRELFLDK